MRLFLSHQSRNRTPDVWVTSETPVASGFCPGLCSTPDWLQEGKRWEQSEWDRRRMGWKKSGRGARIWAVNLKESCASYPPAHLICCIDNLQLRKVHSKPVGRPQTPALVWRHFRKQRIKFPASLIQVDMFRHGICFWLFFSVSSRVAEPGQTCLYSNSLTGSPESQRSRGANGRALTATRVWWGAEGCRAGGRG